MKHQQLYDTLVAFDIDGDPVTQTFEMRLAKENGWTQAFAQKVVQEYKRFVFLTMTADHPCSPSHAVDEAWHLHLTYTESYWLRMVAEVLPRPLHHNPTKGGSAESAKHEDLYKRTLESYVSAFGCEPPRDIWPAPGQKASSVKALVGEENWVIPKTKVRSVALLVAFALVAAGVVVGCMPMLAQAGPQDDPFPTGLVVGGLLLAVLGLSAIFFVVWWVRRTSQYGNTTVIGGADCDGVVIIENEVVACSGGVNCSGGVVSSPAAVEGASIMTESQGASPDMGSASSCSSSSCSSSSCSSSSCSSSSCSCSS